MKRILTAVVLIAVVFALIFLGQLWMLTLVVCLIAELAAYEYLTLANSTGARMSPAGGWPPPPRSCSLSPSTGSTTKLNSPC